MSKTAKLLLALLLCSSPTFSQTWGRYLNGKGMLCNESIVLYKNGEYNTERGCEESSHFSFGNWTQKKDTIFFREANYRDSTAIKSVISKKTAENRLIVKVFDINGVNITERISIGQFVEGKGTYNLDFDSTKMIQYDFKRENSKIVIKTLRKLFGKGCDFPTDASNYYEVTLNISNDWIFHFNSDWGGNGDFKLLKTRQGLRTLEEKYLVDENGKLIVEWTTYIRQSE